jgi:hypothetical protein
MKNTLNDIQKTAVSRKLIEAEILSRAWSDETFLARLEADPAATLAEAGIPVPAGKTLRVIREEPEALQIVLPPKPEATAEASDEELASVSGGGLIENGKCKHYEDAKNRDGDKFLAGFALACGAMFGVSWGYG